PSQGVLEIRAKCRRLQAEHGLGLVVVDYLQLIPHRGRGVESRQQEVSEITRSLKSLAKELSAPVVALSQLSRAVERREERRPRLADLRESGAIEQDADVVMFVYREEEFTGEGVAEIIVGKQRHGPTGTVKLKFFPEFTRFADLETFRRGEEAF
ncbi:MAG: DnaB-like helicase C-terminal domain-containing protein, partial [Nitrospinota bacterium]